MRIIYLLSGPLAQEGFSSQIAKLLKKDLNQKNNIVFIASSPENFIKNDTYVYGNNNNITGLKNHLKEVMEIKKVTIIDNRVDKSKAKEHISKADVVYLLGGNPLNQLKFIKNNNYDTVLKDYQGIILGTSAGAMNLSKKSYYSKDEDYSKSFFYDGIGLVDITIDPHFEITNKTQIEEAKIFSQKHSIIGLPDSSAIRITDDEISYIGDHYPFHNGIMETKLK